MLFHPGTISQHVKKFHEMEYMQYKKVHMMPQDVKTPSVHQTVEAFEVSAIFSIP